MYSQTEVTDDGPLVIEETRYGEEVLVVSLGGELDGAGVGTARTHLRAALTGGCALVVIDLTGLEFIDSAAIALLYELADLRPDRDTLRLLPSRYPAVNRMLAMTDVGQAMRIVAP